MTLFLAEDGHEVRTAENVDLLLAQAEECAGGLHLALLSADLDPGFLAELLTRLREAARQPELIVLVTVPPGAQEVAEDLAGRARVETLHKPFDRNSFLARVRGMLLLVGAGPAPPGPPQSHPRSQAAAALLRPEPVSTAPDLDRPAHSWATEAWLRDELPALVKEAVRELVSEHIEAIAWKMVPELAESLLRREIEKITQELEEVEAATELPSDDP